MVGVEGDEHQSYVIWVIRELFQMLYVCLVVLRLAGPPKPGIGVRLPGSKIWQNVHTLVRSEGVR